MAPARDETSPSRAPSVEAWNALSPAERQARVEALPAALPTGLRSPSEGDAHVDACLEARETLRVFFGRSGRRVYVTTGLTVYNPDAPPFAPDVLVVLGVDPRPREKWVSSAEGKGPDFVMDVHVDPARESELEGRASRYALQGIPECVLYDRGRQRLAAYRLPYPGAREYQPIVAHVGTYVSRVLGLDLRLEGGRLRFSYSGAVLPTKDELVDRLERQAARAELNALEESRRCGRLEERLAAVTAELETLRRGGAPGSTPGS